MLKLPPIYDNEKGMVLSIALLFLAVLTLIGSAAIVSTRTEIKIAGNWNAHTRTFYAAEAGLEKGVADLNALLGNLVSPTTTELNAIAAPTLSVSHFSFDTFKVEFINSSPITIDDGPYQGLRADVTDYQITAEVEGPGGARSRLVQMVEYLEVPLFQFAAFYGKGVDFELRPGPEMIVTGRVHANSDIYIAAGSGGLKFDSYLTTSGKVYRQIKADGTADRHNNPQIKDANGDYQSLNFDHDYSQDFLNNWTPEEWSSTALSKFGGKLQDSAMGVEEILPPIPEQFYDKDHPDVSSHQMIEKGVNGESETLKKAKLYYQADLRIENGEVTQGDLMGCDPNTITTKSFWDKREDGNMEVTEVDVGLLTACGKAPANGILYVQKNGANKGVRLVNGSQLPSQGFTVVSENPIYIQGDYNTVNKVPAAVMGDAVTILSNNWGPNGSDSLGNAALTERPATSTTVNAALATGPSVESTPGADNGKFNNLPRFLERWTGATLTYRGSMIALWHSLEVDGQWRCCRNTSSDYYQPPIRDWGYDTLFDTDQPPGTPKGNLGLRRVAWSEGQI